MAREADALERLKALVAGFDEGALATLASPGLVRRARMDLERGLEVSVEKASGDAVKLRVGDCGVSIPASGPAKATCTCPSATTCRHVLSAVLWLREAHTVPSPPPPSRPVRDELIELGAGGLAAWAGRVALREALALVDRDLDVSTLEKGLSVTVEFRDLGAACSLVAGTGLDGAIVNVGAKERRRLVAASVLALFREWEIPFEREEPAPSSRAGPPGASRARERVLAAASGLVEDTVAMGVAHLSSSFDERLTTLSLSASGAELPRLARLLRTLADEVDLLASRNARADEERLVTTLARARALCAALQGSAPRPPDRLTGRSRGRYDRVAALELTGLGGWRWRTQSGHRGVTALFFDEKTARWLTWSESRPEGVDLAFDPVRRWKDAGPWTGSSTLARLATSRLRIAHPRTGDGARLSSSAESVVTPGDPTDPSAVDFGSRLFTDWKTLRAYAASGAPLGLDEPEPLWNIVVVRPTTWGPKVFDELGQRFVWPVTDASGESLPLELDWDEATEHSVGLLEQLDPQRHGVTSVVASVRLRGEAVFLQPLVVLRDGAGGDGAVLSISLEDLPAGIAPAARMVERFKQAFRSRVRLGEREESAESALGSTFNPAPLVALEGLLQEVAERGTRASSPAILARALSVAADLEARGLGLLGRAAASLSASPEAVLRLRYLCLIHRETALRRSVAGPNSAPLRVL